MPKRCPKCKKISSSQALRCTGLNCDHVFSPESSVMPKPPEVTAAPTVIPPPAPAVIPPPAPVSEAPTALLPAPEAPHSAVHSQVARLEKDVAAGHSEIHRLRASLEQALAKVSAAATTAPVTTATTPATPAPATTRPAVGTPVAAAPVATPGWMSAALGLLARWPKSAAAVGTLMTLATGFTGWTGYRSVTAPSALDAGASTPEKNVALPAPGGQSDITSPPPGPAATSSGPAAGRGGDSVARESVLSARETAVTARESQAVTKESGLKIREDGLNSRQEALKIRETDAAAKERALKAREDTMLAQSRIPPRADVSMGVFSVRVPKMGRRDSEFTVVRETVQGRWPSGNCAVVSISPLRSDTMPEVLATACSDKGIVIKKLNGLQEERVAVVVWQLR